MSNTCKAQQGCFCVSKFQDNTSELMESGRPCCDEILCGNRFTKEKDYIALVQCREIDLVRNQLLWHMHCPDWPVVGYPFPHFGKAGSLSCRDQVILFVRESSAVTFEYLKCVVYLQELKSAACSPALLFGFPVVYIPLVLARPSHVLCLCLHRVSPYSIYVSNYPANLSFVHNKQQACLCVSDNEGG